MRESLGLPLYVAAGYCDLGSKNLHFIVIANLTENNNSNFKLIGKHLKTHRQSLGIRDYFKEADKTGNRQTIYG